MDAYDFVVGWPEPRDPKDLFINTLEKECKARRLRFACIDERGVDNAIKETKRGNFKARFYLDMASETYDANNTFTKFAYHLKDTGARVIDDPDDVKAAADKSITHFDLMRAKVPVPYSVVIRHWEPSRKLADAEREGLGTPFVLKPALGYGQKGVQIIKKRLTLKELNEARVVAPGDNFLLQEFITPLTINSAPAWFRVYQLFGEIIPCWWNPATHEYAQVTVKEFDELKLMPLARIASEIGRITRIDWFSCEIAINERNRKFVVIDYMNDQCAIYPKSAHKDGVPDELVVLISQRIVEKAWHYVRGEYTLTHRAIWFPKVRVKDETA